jgi:hypothetical protein
MNVPQLKEFCRGFPSVTETLYEQPPIFLSTLWVVRNLLISKLVIRNGGVSALEWHPIALLS